MKTGEYNDGLLLITFSGCYFSFVELCKMIMWLMSSEEIIDRNVNFMNNIMLNTRTDMRGE